MPELYIGLISGTSTDGVDAALVDFTDDSVELIDFVYQPYTAEIKSAIQQLSNPDKPVYLHDFGAMDCRLGHLFADAANALLAQNGLPVEAIQAIGSHGQTVCHAPHGPLAFSLQIGDPNVIAETTGIATVADFRRRDMACQGQGAPLVPAFHQAVFSHPDWHRCIINIGGIANITILPPAQSKSPVLGFDTGPGNTLMDDWIHQHKRLGFDRDGAWAKSGRIDYPWVNRCKQDAYFQLPPPKSTGKEYFSRAWLERHLSGNEYPPENVQASLCYLSASSICEAIRRHAPETQEVLLCGGGAHNGFLRQLIAEHLDCPVASTADLGIAPDQVEAMAFAWLARQTLKSRPGNLREVTGAKCATVLGGIYQPNRH